jgi:Dna[CI] antecedent DciA-like protein
VSSHRDKPASLGSLLATSRDAAARHAGTAIDREQWRRIVGERIAARTEPGPKRGRELTVYAASASWAQELSLLVNEIVVRIKAAGFGVDNVRFAVREIKARTRDAPAPKPTVRKAALPSALNQQLNRIADTELRDAIAEAASLWLARDDNPAQSQRAASIKPAPTSTRPSARSPRDAESQSARSDRTPSPGRGASRGKL